MSASREAFFDWEARPAVMLNDGRVLAVVRNGDWSTLSEEAARDVLAAGAMISAKDFADRFPDADTSTIPRD